MNGLIVAAFAGPGGMCTGARLAGHTGPMVGIDHDMAACRTAVAAGHLRVQADIATYPLEHLAGKVGGLTLTPPCPTFSNAGTGAGRHLIALLCTAMTRTMRGENVVAWTRREAAKLLRPVAMQNRKLRKATRAQRSAWVRRMAVMSVLAVEPARWVRELRPRWVALEQVPAVLPLWRHFASLLRQHGYQAWAGKLDAECYGVPQTRDRAILVARNDGAAVGPPPPTHQAYVSGREPETAPGLFGDPLPPPVSMADALGWGLPDRPSWTVTAGGTETGGAEVFGNAKNRAELRDVVLRNGRQANATERGGDEPAGTVLCSRPGNLNWVLRNGNQANACTRALDEPAATFFGNRANAVDWIRTGNNSRIGNGQTVEYERSTAAPSPTLTGNVNRWQAGNDTEQTVRVTVTEAGVLQSFPADYPWVGTKSEQYRQVGDAVPPLLAAAILRPLIQTEAQGRAA